MHQNILGIVIYLKYYYGVNVHVFSSHLILTITVNTTYTLCADEKTKNLEI